MRLRLGSPAEPAFVRSTVAGELSIQNVTSRDFERMDRAHDRVLHMEACARLTDRMTEEKYRASMEQVGRAILTYSQNPGLDALRLFELTLFCFLTGNSDMHLKNFSLIYAADGLVHLAPAYDLLPTQLLLPEDREETALTLNGKKNRLARGDFAALAKSLELTERADCQCVCPHGRVGCNGVKDRCINPSFRIDPGMSSWRSYQYEATASAFLEMPGQRRLGKGRLR